MANISDIVADVKGYLRDADEGQILRAASRFKRRISRKYDFPWCRLSWLGVTSGGTFQSSVSASYNPSAMLAPPRMKRPEVVSLFTKVKPTASQVGTWRGIDFRIVPSSGQLAWIRTNASGIQGAEKQILRPLDQIRYDGFDDLGDIVFGDGYAVVQPAGDVWPVAYTIGTGRMWADHMGAATTVAEQEPAQADEPLDKFFFFHPQIPVGTFYWVAMTYIAYLPDYGDFRGTMPQMGQGDFPEQIWESDGFTENAPDMLIQGALGELFDIHGDGKRAFFARQQAERLARELMDEQIGNEIEGIVALDGGSLKIRIPG